MLASFPERSHKGIRAILLERAKWPLDGQGRPSDGFHLDCKDCLKKVADDPDRGTRTLCCARRLLASQPDFQAQRSLLEEVARELGCEVFFLPKFHCEINSIGESVHCNQLCIVQISIQP